MPIPTSNSEGTLPVKPGEDGLTDRQAGSAHFSTFGQNPNAFVNADGKLLGDRPHTFKTQLVVELPHGFLVGANYLFQSGRAWARKARIEEFDNLGFSQRAGDQPRGARRKSQGPQPEHPGHAAPEEVLPWGKS